MSKPWYGRVDDRSDILLSSGGAIWLKFPPVIMRLSDLLNIFQSIHQICVGDWGKTVQKMRMKVEAEKALRTSTITGEHRLNMTTSPFEYHHCVKFLLWPGLVKGVFREITGCRRALRKCGQTGVLSTKKLCVHVLVVHLWTPFARSSCPGPSL